MLKINLRNCRPEQRKDIRAAAILYAERLMGPKLAANLDINITFVPGLRRHQRIRGDAIYREREYVRRHRKFSIRLDDDMCLRLKLLILAHEMVHVKQFARNELRSFGNDRTRWQGKRLSESTINYWVRPWELEARGWEMALYAMWKQHKKKIT